MQPDLLTYEGVPSDFVNSVFIRGVPNQPFMLFEALDKGSGVAIVVPVLYK